MGTAAKELAARAREAASTQTPTPTILPETITLHTATPMPAQQLASTPTPLAPASEISAPLPTPGQWMARVATEQPQVRQL